jgi:glycosyltransferase involved in cell wall biosynthesis
MKREGDIRRPAGVLFMGTYPPRECGIATFTKDLTDAVAENISPQVSCEILAMNDNGSNVYNYPKNVIHQINDRDVNEYIKAARIVNRMDHIKLVNIQHEFGIFGNNYGINLLAFLKELNKPAIITLHSILPSPNDDLKHVVQELAENSDAFVVMAEMGREILRNDYEIQNEIFFIPHGIPFVPFESSVHEKKNLGYQNRIVLSSFGMMNRGKGYEHVIESLPSVIEKFPNLLYLIVGETHPIVRKHEGEEYRNYLGKRIKSLGLQDHVKFYNKYIKLHEIIKYLKATDIYISSSLDPNQITSGTLSYAMGAGRAVISTPFLHAKELVNGDRGKLVEFGNPDSFTDAIGTILEDRNLKKRMAMNAYHYTRAMTWPNVALAYEKVFEKYMRMPEWRKNRIPEIKFSHLINLTDNFGVVQFAQNFEPNLRYGYTTDDISRALVACCMCHEKSSDSSKLHLIKTYLNYIKYVQDRKGRFYNFVNRNKKVNSKRWSDDAHGRALWGLGYTMSTQKVPEEHREESREMFDKAMPFVEDISSPRAMAFTILGSYFYNNSFPSRSKRTLIKNLANNLVLMYNENQNHDWQWFEDSLTYDNSRIPEALFYAYLTTGDEKYLNIAKITLDFLSSVSFHNGVFMPVGQRGWFKKGEEKATFDQQPVDVGAMVQTLVLANNITRERKYADKASRAFNWFLGKNILNQVIYDNNTGGCYDGIGQECININQGAESTISYLLARLSMENMGRGKVVC